MNLDEFREDLEAEVKNALTFGDVINPTPKGGGFMTFLFVTSFLKGRFATQLDYISRTHENIQGAAIDVANLLYLAEVLKTSKIAYRDFFKLFGNQEIRITLP